MGIQVETVRSVEVPTRMVHGPGSIARLGGLVRGLGVRRPLLVTDRGVAAAGLADRALAHLEGAVLFADVYPNPDIELVGRASAESFLGPARADGGRPDVRQPDTRRRDVTLPVEQEVGGDAHDGEVPDLPLEL